jgi:preprotein translocase subunit SecF
MGFGQHVRLAFTFTLAFAFSSGIVTSLVFVSIVIRAAGHQRSHKHRQQNE